MAALGPVKTRSRHCSTPPTERRHFDAEVVEELGSSKRDHHCARVGIEQPLVDQAIEQIDPEGSRKVVVARPGRP
jgi:hypothetical protein